ncbi:hypothetical protein B0H14DRAFT_2605065 [Mycena olivaceomarginata]|nr:hypothetical protein B0H14DRAFT_2605065 [Mycena olivaceomarginata]
MWAVSGFPTESIVAGFLEVSTPFLKYDTRQMRGGSRVEGARPVLDLDTIGRAGNLEGSERAVVVRIDCDIRGVPKRNSYLELERDSAVIGGYTWFEKGDDIGQTPEIGFCVELTSKKPLNIEDRQQNRALNVRPVVNLQRERSLVGLDMISVVKPMCKSTELSYDTFGSGTIGNSGVDYGYNECRSPTVPKYRLRFGCTLYLELELDSTVIGGDGLKKLATPVIGFCV